VSIQQIIPGAGWQAVTLTNVRVCGNQIEPLDADAQIDSMLFLQPLVAWALLEDENEIVGCLVDEIRDVYPVSDDDLTFICYLGPGEGIDDFIRDDAQRRLRSGA
jgi:hypothetical protein